MRQWLLGLHERLRGGGDALRVEQLVLLLDHVLGDDLLSLGLLLRYVVHHLRLIRRLLRGLLEEVRKLTGLWVIETLLLPDLLLRLRLVMLASIVLAGVHVTSSSTLGWLIVILMWRRWRWVHKLLLWGWHRRCRDVVSVA